jgi:hypothetical protein
MSTRPPAPTIGTFDVILFAGTQWYPSRLIEWFTGSPYSHIALGLHSPTYIDAKLAEGYYIIESGEELRPCVTSGQLVWGPQIQPWREILDSYPGRVYVRRFQWLNRPPPARDIEQRMLEAWQATSSAVYDDNPLDWIRDELGLNLDSDCRKTNEFVCSVYAAYLLYCIGVLPTTIEWGHFLPRDYAPGGHVDSLLQAQGLAQYGPIEQLK